MAEAEFEGKAKLAMAAKLLDMKTSHIWDDCLIGRAGRGFYDRSE